MAPSTESSWLAEPNGHSHRVRHYPRNGGGAGHSGFTHGWKNRDKLPAIDWHGMKISPVHKDFSHEHPAVAARTEEECERIRIDNSIHIVSNESDEPVPRPIVRFDEAPFPDWLSKRMRNLGQGTAEKPTPIQVQAWPILLKGFDFVGIAETGSGKTAAYLAPMVVHILAQPELKPGEGPIGLVIVPTRDLALQVAKQMNDLLLTNELVCRALHGGGSRSSQIVNMDSIRTDIAVVTPGRLIQLLNSQSTNLRRATCIVLDEADELLNEGFEEQVKLILAQIRPDRQAMMFSATWHKVVSELAVSVCASKCIRIQIGSTQLSACKSISQSVVLVQQSEKLTKLCLALSKIRGSMSSDPSARALIFCNLRESVDPLVTKLGEKGYPCIGFHGEFSQARRDHTLQEFASTESPLWILVCTQILGRGYDFSNVKYVINYDMPYRIVEYIHRIGRTGRAGQSGFSLTFYSQADNVARDLITVLRESEQGIPDWLLKELNRKRHRRNTYIRGKPAITHSRANGTNRYLGLSSPAATSQWKGRGKGRRQLFLDELEGQGLARKPS